MEGPPGRLNVNVIDQNTGALAPQGAPRNNCVLPAALVYDPVTNPNGTRCGDPDLATAVWGATTDAFWAEASTIALLLVLLSGVLTWLLVLRRADALS